MRLRDEYGYLQWWVFLFIGITVMALALALALAGDYYSDGEIVWSTDQDQANAQQEIVKTMHAVATENAKDCGN